ncbi:MAG: DUF6675 family protein [Candidatus Sedimenticola sp. (ex Thyasira tokunagai)]
MKGRDEIGFFRLLLILFWLLPVTAETATDIDAFFTPDEKSRALAGTIISYTYLKGSSVISSEGDPPSEITLPDTEYIRGAEYADYEMLAVEKAFIPYPSPDPLDVNIYNRLTSYAGLKGMNYYSKTEGERIPLIIESSRIPSPKIESPLKDVIYKSIPVSRTDFFRMVDNRFGELRFKSEVESVGDHFIVRHTSTHGLKRWVFDVNEPGENRLIYLLFRDRVAGGYFYYAFHGMRIRSGFILGLGMLLPENFANRLRAGTVNAAKQFGIDWSDRITAFK